MIFNMTASSGVDPIPTLPPEYQLVEYIMSNDVNCDIDTGLVYTRAPKVDIVFRFIYINNQDADILGTNVAESGCFIVDVFQNNTFYYRDGKTTAVQVLFTSPLVDFHRVVFSPTKIEYDGELLLNVTPGDFSLNTRSIHLFRGRTGYKYLQLKKAVLYENDVLQREMYPCYRKNDGVIGMYDLVGNTFYTNQGTGSFTKGADL